jgi:hypothetical protein
MALALWRLMVGASRSASMRFFERAYDALPEAAAVDDPEATIPSTARRRRNYLQQGVLFGFGVFLGVLVVMVTDFDRAFVNAYAQQPIVVEAPASRRVARRVPKVPPHGSSTRAIPTLDVRELPTAEE